MLPQPFPILIQLGVGALAGFLYVKVLKKPVFGQLWGALIVGVIGGVLGGFFLNNVTKFLVLNPLTVDFIATLVGAYILLWLLSKLHHQ